MLNIIPLITILRESRKDNSRMVRERIVIKADEESNGFYGARNNTRYIILAKCDVCVKYLLLRPIMLISPQVLWALEKRKKCRRNNNNTSSELAKLY